MLNQYITSGGGGGGSPVKTVLFVTNGAAEARDTAIDAILVAAGWTVTAATDSTVVEADATGLGLILISHTADDANMATLFRTTAVPIVFLTEIHNVAYDMASAVANTGFINSYNITSATLALAAFSTGSLQILSNNTSLGYAAAANLGAGAQILATSGTADENTVFVYESGAAMLNSLTAPARRVSSGFSGQAGQRLNSVAGDNNDGEDLFLALCDWAATPPGGGGAPVAATAPQSISSPAKTDTTVDLSWAASTTGADSYTVYQQEGEEGAAVVAGSTAGTTFTATGLAEETPYTFWVVATLGGRDSQRSPALVVVTEPAAPPAPGGFDREVALQNAGFSEAEIAAFVKISNGGGRLGGTKTVIPDPDYANHPLTLAPYLSVAYTEAGYKATRLARFDQSQPESGNATALTSEREVCTIVDGSGHFIYFEKTTTNNLLCTEISTNSKLIIQQWEVSISHLSEAERLQIHPHPALANEVWYGFGASLERMNLRTGARVQMLSLGYTPAPDWANGDGNGMTNGCCLISDTTEQRVWIFDVAAEACVTMAGGVRATVPVANRVTVTLPAPGGSSLDYAYTDGRLVYAVIKGGAGPDGRSGLHAYAPGEGFIDVIWGGTGHYSRQQMTVGAGLQTSHSVKVTPGQVSQFGGIFNTADSISVAAEFTWNGSSFDMARTARRNMPWNYSYNPPSGGQRAGQWDTPNIAALSMKAAHTSSTENEGNYITENFWAKECLLIFHLENSDDFEVIGKNLTRRNKPVSKQTEINFGRPCADGSLLLFMKSAVGPEEGSSDDILNSKDIWMIEIPPRMPDSRIQYYLNL